MGELVHRHAALAAADEGAGEGIRLAHDCVVDELLLALLVRGAGEDAITDHGERGHALEEVAAFDAEQLATQLRKVSGQAPLYYRGYNISLTRYVKLPVGSSL